MAVSSGPKITKDGLVLYLDAANFKSNKGKRSLINWNDWVSGSTGSTGAWGRNGLVEENERTLAINPFGNVDVIWDTPSNDAASGGDGGWNLATAIGSIDPTKMYRFTTWMKRRVVGNGYSYLGTYGFENTTNVGVLWRSSGANNTNPYFKSSGWWGSADIWYLVVGHVWPYGSGTGSNHPDTGVWNLNGSLASSCADFVWGTLATNRTYHRSYLYYSTDTTTSQQWYQPRIDLCDGTEPTLQELLNDVGNKVTDLTGLGNNGIATGSVGIDTDNRGSFIFDGVDDYIDLGNPSISAGKITVNCWVKVDNSSPKIQHVVDSSSNTWHLAVLSNNVPYFYNGTSYHTGGPAISNNTWYMLTGVQGTTLDIYVNGKLNSSIASNLNVTTNNINIGRWQSNTTRNFKGNVAQASIHNRALSQAEIKQIYEATRARYGL